MKVKVNVKHVPLNQVEYFLNEALSEALADLDAAHREIERLVQENKELRLAEARTLSDKKKAEADLSALKKQMHDQEEKACDEYTKVFEELVSLRSKFSDTCAERDNLQAAYKQVQASISQIVLNFDEDRKELEGEIKRVCKEKQELYSQLADKDEEIEALQRVAEDNEKYKDKINELSDENCNLHLQLDGAEKVIKSLETQLTHAELCNAALESRLEETTAELRPQFSNLWQLLKDTGMIIDTEGGVHNHE